MLLGRARRIPGLRHFRLVDIDIGSTFLQVIHDSIDAAAVVRRILGIRALLLVTIRPRPFRQRIVTERPLVRIHSWSHKRSFRRPSRFHLERRIHRTCLQSGLPRRFDQLDTRAREAFLRKQFISSIKEKNVPHNHVGNIKIDI